jgi:DNA repair protein RecN (Recombination protein N)
MLNRLYIRNYALIEELTINFSDKLTIITGETGAGKSILLGALGLIMGERADSKIFYNQNEKCIVEGSFDVSAYDLQSFFEEHELDYDVEVLIRRELSPTGKSRAFINDTPVNNQVLKRLTEALVDLHQQFDVLDIHHVNFQLRMIDALAGNQQRMAQYSQLYRSYAKDKKELKHLQSKSAQGAREMEFLLFQLKELEEAELQPGEQEELEESLRQLENAEEIKRNFGALFTHLVDGENTIINQIQELNRPLTSLRNVSRSLDQVGSRLDSILAELEDVAKECERIAEETEYEPQRIEEIQERLNQLYKLQKKHSVGTVEELLSIQDQMQSQASGFTDLSAQIEKLEKALGKQHAELVTKAVELRKAREAVVPSFETKVGELLTLLSMPHAALKVDVTHLDQVQATGMDEVQFLFASNAGSRFLPIKQVASGGELSRLTLCTKSLVADAIPLPTLIFDEIDTGVSGDVSMQMGKILKELSSRHQVVSITHTPQVAARADKHYFVYKKTEGARTITNIRLLNEEERLRSVAVMLSGNPPSEAALVTANELVKA